MDIEITIDPWGAVSVWRELRDGIEVDGGSTVLLMLTLMLQRATVNKVSKI